MKFTLPQITRKPLLIRALSVAAVFVLLSIVVWADNRFEVITQKNTEIKHKANHLIVTREGLEKPIFYEGAEGIFQSEIKLQSGDFIGCIEDTLYADYDDLDSVIYVKNGISFFRLPRHYKAPVQQPTGPLLHGVGSRSLSYTTVAPVTGFLCVEYADTLSKMFDTMTLRSDSVPIAGEMIYDGLVLCPMPDELTEVTVNFENSNKFVIPVPADVDLNLELIATNSKTNREKTFTIKDNIARGTVSCHKIYSHRAEPVDPDSVIVPQPLPEIEPIEADTVIPKKKDHPVPPIPDRDRWHPKKHEKKEKEEKDPCGPYKPISLRDILKDVYDNLPAKHEIDPNNFKNWGSELPLNKWKNVKKTASGYYVCIEPNKQRMFGAAISLSAVNDIGLTAKNEKIIRKLLKHPNPECEIPSHYLYDQLSFDRCDSLKELKLHSLRYSKLVISRCEFLKRIELVDCSVEELVIECCPNLQTIEAPLNRLQTFNIRRCPNISFINVTCNRLQYLNLRNLPELEYLNCSLNYIEDLDLSHNPHLKTLICAYNNLSGLNLVKQTELKKLSTLGNKDNMSIYPPIDELIHNGLQMYNFNGKIVVTNPNNTSNK